MKKIISAADFAQQYSNDLCVLDLRTQGERNGEYIEGSLHLSVQDLDPQNFEVLLNNVESEQPVYLMCQSGRRAVIAAEKLSDSARPLVLVEGGINALKTLNFNLASGGSKVISMQRQVQIVAGSMVLVGVVLGFGVHPNFFGLSAFVGAGLVFSGVTDTCAMMRCLAVMPWNKG